MVGKTIPGEDNGGEISDSSGSSRSDGRHEHRARGGLSGEDGDGEDGERRGNPGEGHGVSGGDPMGMGWRAC